MSLTVFAMGVLIVWAIRNIIQDLGIKDVISNKSKGGDKKNE